MGKHWSKILQFKPKSILVIAISITSIISNPELLLAQSKQQTNNQTPKLDISFIPPQPEPPHRGTPRTDEGTGSRGDCLHKPSLPPLTSLVGTKQLKLTTSSHPTFWVYVPYTQAEAPYGEFSLQTGEREIYRTQLQLPGKPGIVGVSLPSTVPPLEVGKPYRWYVDINCAAAESAADFSTPASLTGMVERIDFPANLNQELETTSKPLKRIANYAEHGIWYDALTELVQLCLQQPENNTLKQTWHKLLSDRHVDLEDISSEPILGRLKAKSEGDPAPTTGRKRGFQAPELNSGDSPSGTRPNPKGY